jgi:prepilin-type N-terminal cleavage/methylation domain-containing protein
MRKMFYKFKSDKGMTLVEVLVVAAILGVVVMAVMSLFIPTVQNTAVQTEVSDVQSNLRLAIDRMTDDLLTAGFLMDGAAPSINNDATGFTIQTRLVGSGFGRTTAATGDKITLAQEAMLTSFPQGSSLRLFNPSDPTAGSSQIYEVKNVDADDPELTIEPTINSSLGSGSLVVVSVAPGAPLIQTIRYQFEDGTLTRTVNNGQKQFLARGIDDVSFDYWPTPTEVRRVDINLTGVTEERIVNGAPTQKTRELRTSVTLRNTF